jgi:hypothetical protein
METKVATDAEVSNLDKRIKTIFKKRVRFNHKNIETFASMEDDTSDVQNKIMAANQAATQQTSNIGTVDEDDLEALGEEIESDMEKKGTKWQRAFAFLKEIKASDMYITFDGIRPVAKGWGKIFRALFYIYPIIASLIVQEFTEAVPITMEGDINVDQFLKNREHDSRVMLKTAHEFGYILVAMYFSHMLYSKLYGSHPLKTVDKYLKTGNFVFDIFAHSWIFYYLLLIPEMYHYFLNDGLKGFLNAYFSTSPTLKYLIIFIFCYAVAYFFLDILAKSFLQVFEYKANPLIYVAIVFSFLYKLLTLNVLNKGIMTFTFGLYIFVFLIHLALSLMGGPLCQLIAVIYIVFSLVGGPGDIWDLLRSFVFKTVKSFFFDAQVDCHGSTTSNTNEIMGGFDNLAYLYVYRYLFYFVMMLFFFFKTIQSAVEMKVVTIRTAAATTNAYITATMAVIYFAKLYMDKGFTKQEYTIGKKPAANEDAGEEGEGEGEGERVGRGVAKQYDNTHYDEDPSLIRSPRKLRAYKKRMVKDLQVRISISLCLCVRFRGLYLYTVGVLFPIKWCIRLR